MHTARAWARVLDPAPVLVTLHLPHSAIHAHAPTQPRTHPRPTHPRTHAPTHPRTHAHAEQQAAHKAAAGEQGALFREVRARIPLKLMPSAISNLGVCVCVCVCVCLCACVCVSVCVHVSPPISVTVLCVHTPCVQRYSRTHTQTRAHQPTHPPAHTLHLPLPTPQHAHAGEAVSHKVSNTLLKTLHAA